MSRERQAALIVEEDEAEPFRVFSEPGPSVTVEPHGDRTLITASGDVRGRAQEVANIIQRLDPFEHPRITLDLRKAHTISPLIIHALMRAWERRDRTFGCIRVQTVPGEVARYVHQLRLEHALDLQHEIGDAAGPALQPVQWEAAQLGSIEHFHRLLDAAQAKDLDGFLSLTHQAHPICEGAGAPAGGTAIGKWCGHCPLAEQYGGCHPLLDQMNRAAQAGNWEAAQMLVLALIAEVAGGPLGKDA